MERVLLRSCAHYDVEGIKSILNAAFEELAFSIRGAKVLIKPNLLTARAPEKAVTTHPALVQALAELLKDYSCTVVVGDSPGFESTERVLKVSGIMDVIDHLGLTISRFDRTIVKHTQGISPYREFVFGDDPLDYDAVINMPKLKTHGMMGMTLGVKNTFGFVHSFHKAKWHLRAGQDRSRFASMLIDIHTLVDPSLTILDGIIGMDGDGPSGGRPRKLGILGVSRNAFVLDESIEKLLGLNATPVTELASQHGLIPAYEIGGDDVGEVDDFQLPTTMKTDWNLPSLAKKLLKGVLVKKPKVNSKVCKGCSICVKVCPAQAISLTDSKPRFDYQQCIRCYCCQELCPENAIGV